MTKVSLEAMLRRASREAEKMFDEQGSVDMFWLAETAGGEQFNIITPMDRPPEISENEIKNDVADKVRGLFRKHDVTRYVQVCEVWEGKDDSCRPSEDPERSEIIYINAADEHEHLVATRDIVRPPNGKPYLAKLGEIERPKELGSGRFMDMLPRAGRLRRSSELDDSEGRVFLTDVPGAPICVIGRRDPATGDLCFSGTYDVTKFDEKTAKLFASPPTWIEVITGPEAEQLVAAVIKLRAKKEASSRL
jgi:hypothetical protein